MNHDLKTSDFDFALPPARIAQMPLEPRDSARLLHVTAGALSDRRITDLVDLLHADDLLVMNDTRVIPARLFGHRGTVSVETLLHKKIAPRTWTAFARPGKRLKIGDTVTFAENFFAEILRKHESGEVDLRFSASDVELMSLLLQHGAPPLPPYIKKTPEDARLEQTRYQTVYARHDGAVAAPTAGLHFTPELLTRLADKGVEMTKVTLHVGAGTFSPVKADYIKDHVMHSEWGQIDTATADQIVTAKQAGRRIIAVGTTSLRLLESAAADGTVRPFSGETDIFITPGYRFKAVDALLTNFHLPKSTLFMLVCAFMGIECMRKGLCIRHCTGLSFLFIWRCLFAGTLMTKFSFEISATDGAARRGRVTTQHGVFETPCFMATATAATVKGMHWDDVKETGAELAICNTYHLMLRPSPERVARLGGLHKFTGWNGPILTDSGGFQVMSLAALRDLTEQGVTFRSHLDGTAHNLTPERSMEIQHLLDSNITMCLDECTPHPATHEQAAQSMRMSMRWAKRCKSAFRQREGYALFGIIQGSTYNDLRSESAAALTDIGFDGYGIGGLAVGEGQEAMLKVLDDLTPQLAREKPRYLMGVGKPGDLVGAVLRGVDMFDCVMPTRSGRTGQGFTHRGTVNIRNARHIDDARPLDARCDCQTCTRYSRAYLHHLFRCEEMLGPMLLSWHNLYYYQGLMRDMRTAIENDRLVDYAVAFAEDQARGDLEAVA